MQYKPSNPISSTSFLILSYRLRLVLRVVSTFQAFQKDPQLSSNHSLFIHQRSLAVTSRDNREARETWRENSMVRSTQIRNASAEVSVKVPNESSCNVILLSHEEQLLKAARNFGVHMACIL